MSPTKMARKIQSSSRKDIPHPLVGVSRSAFAQVVADALHREFDESHGAVKIVVGLTGANARAVKNWFEAKNGPTGKHLVDLVGISDEVLEAVLIMSGRHDLVAAKKLGDSKQVLLKMLTLIAEMQEQPIPDPRDVIYSAFYSACVKYPKEGDPAQGNHWIEPGQSAHLTKVVMLELEANGFQIVKKGG